MELVGGQAGKVDYKLKFEAGKLVVEAMYDGGILDGGVKLSVDSELVLDALAKAIPGTLDDRVLAQAKALLKEMK